MWNTRGARHNLRKPERSGPGFLRNPERSGVPAVDS
jgi:hypothetical protein